MLLTQSFGDEVTIAFQFLAAQARADALEAGVAIFYRDSVTGLEIMEQPGGRKFEVRYIPGAP